MIKTTVDAKPTFHKIIFDTFHFLDHILAKL